MKRHLTEEELIQHRFKLASDEQTAGGWSEHLDGCDRCRQRLELISQKFAALDLLAEDVPASEELISQTIAQAKRPAPRRVIPFRRSHWITTAAAVLVVGFALMMGNFYKFGAERREIAKEPKSEGAAQHDIAPSLSQAAEEEQVRVVAKGLSDKMEARLEETVAGRQVAMRSAPAPSTPIAEEPTDSLGVAAIPLPDAETDPRQHAFAPRGRRSAPQMPDETTKLSFGPKSAPDRVQQTTAAWTQMPEDVRPSAGATGTDSALAKISPPFAPASAIELVTLPRRDNVQLTIYNSADLTLVREKRNLTLKQGWNWLQLMWANTLIDPTSLSLEPAAQAGKVDVQQLVFPASPPGRIGRWLIRSEISGQVPFEITYFTSGLSWRAFYMGTLSRDEKKMRLTGFVNVANGSGEDYENAQTRLLVGKVNVLDEIADLAKRQYAYGRPGAIVGRDNYLFIDKEVDKDGDGLGLDRAVMVAGTLGDLKPKEIRKEGLSEYFLYTIEGTETIPDKWAKRLPSFDVEDIEIESLYKYDEERWGRQAMRFVSFANDAEHNLGDTPIPNGAVEVFGRADRQGHLSYLGSTDIKYIPVGEEIELNLGPARLVEVEPKLMAFETDNYVFDNRGNVAGWDKIQTWQVEITNTRKLPVEIEITRDFGTAYWTLVMVDIAPQAEDAVSYEKHDATHARFTLNRRPHSKWTFGYTVTTYHGRRQERVNQ